MRSVAPLSLVTPFRVRSFRFQWPADLLTSCAFEMETLILGWYVLVETGSVLLLTVFGALLFAGTLVAPVFGVVGDRIGHRALLCLMRAFYTLQAAALMTIAFAGLLTPLIVFFITGLMGIVRPSDIGVRSALVADNMPADRLMSAMGVARTTSDLARVAGALAGASLFAAFGVGSAYVVVVLSYALGLLLTWHVKPRRDIPHRAGTAQPALQPPSAWADLREGIIYVWSHPLLLAAMLLAFLVNLTAFPLSNGLLPYVARNVYRMDQTGLGYLVASFAFGALLGSITVSLLAGRQPAQTMIASAAAWHLALLVFGLLQSPCWGVVLLILAGMAQSFCMVSLAVLLLRLSSARFRGRVMGVRMLAIYSLPLGLLAAGALVESLGFAATASTYAMTGLLFTALIALRWRTDLWPAGASAGAPQSPGA
jgi:predicted MFS family arabinose efflux permease